MDHQLNESNAAVFFNEWLKDTSSSQGSCTIFSLRLVLIDLQLRPGAPLSSVGKPHPALAQVQSLVSHPESAGRGDG